MMRGRGKQNRVDFNKPPDPKFIQQLKSQIGYKEPASIETKREVLPSCSNDEDDQGDDEKPTIVVLKEGDLTQDEVRQIEKSTVTSDLDEPSGTSRVIFKKPVKREAKLNTDDRVDGTKKIKSTSDTKVKNKSLLSFDEDEEDNDDE